MKPVVHLQGKVIQVRDINAGSGVGYGATWRAPSPRRIATVSVGYADGFLRSLSNRARRLVRRHPLALVGIVSMDTITLDVSGAARKRTAAGQSVDLIRRPAHSGCRGRRRPAPSATKSSPVSGGRYFRQY